MYYRAINAEACIPDSEQADDEDEDENTEEGKEQNPADGESEADEHGASVASESKVRGTCVFVAASYFSSRAFIYGWSVSLSKCSAWSAGHCVRRGDTHCQASER